MACPFIGQLAGRRKARNVTLSSGISVALKRISKRAMSLGRLAPVVSGINVKWWTINAAIELFVSLNPVPILTTREARRPCKGTDTCTELER